MNGATAEDWKALLLRLNSSVLTSDRPKKNLAAEMLSSGWCGLPPATLAEVAAAERRLGVPLPPSYRAFLSVSNGWPLFDAFIERLLPVQEVNWLASADPDGLSMIREAYREDDIADQDYLNYDEHAEAMRHRYYPKCLLVGKAWESEGEMILLNSIVVSTDGEWEAIFFADWLPGNQRFRSFYELVDRRLRVFES